MKRGMSLLLLLMMVLCCVPAAAEDCPKLLFTPIPTAAPTPAATPAPTGLRMKEGDTGTQVRAVQTRLKELGFFSGTVDGCYGPDTTAAVSEFQRLNGITGSGKVNQYTYEKLMRASAIPKGTPVPAVAKQGDSGSTVYTIQVSLKALGYPVNGTAYYNTLTAWAVRQFQADQGLPVTG